MQIIKIKRGGKNVKASGAKKPKTYLKVLAENAMALGWLNGHRLKRKNT